MLVNEPSAGVSSGMSVTLNWCAVNHITRRFSNHESRLLSQSHTFAIIVILDLKIHQNVDTLTLFLQKLESMVIDP